MLPLQTDTLQNRYGKRAMSLFVSKDEESLTYDGFRQLLERRAKQQTRTTRFPPCVCSQHAAQRCGYFCFAETGGTF
jgi:hypothetical protein